MMLNYRAELHFFRLLFKHSRYKIRSEHHVATRGREEFYFPACLDHIHYTVLVTGCVVVFMCNFLWCILIQILL